MSGKIGKEVLDMFERASPVVLRRVQDMPNWCGVWQKQLLSEFAKLPYLIAHAAYSNQISKVRDVDAQLCAIRSAVRIAAQNELRWLSIPAETAILNVLHPIGLKINEWKAQINSARGRDKRYATVRPA